MCIPYSVILEFCLCYRWVDDLLFCFFLARLEEVQEELAIVLPRASALALVLVLALAGAVALAKCLSFYVKVFYVMGKALSGKLSCPCDRSCSTVFQSYQEDGRVIMKDCVLWIDDWGCYILFNSILVIY